METILSLVIPTNGIVDWVCQVVESIYMQDVNENLYEVIITDNGSNKEFEHWIKQYTKLHSNLIYKKTNAVLFMNQIEAFKLANGKFIKFVNHRTKLLPGTLKKLLNFVYQNENKKPITFFSNNAFYPQYKSKEYFFSEFDQYIYGLSIYSSWSGGVSCWKSDLSWVLNNNLISDKTLFPHMKFILLKDNDRKYQINNDLLFEEIKAEAKKGKYDVFYAFSVEYINIMSDLLKKEYIDKITFDYIYKKNEEFLVNIFTDYVLLKNVCSYDLSTAKEMLNINYSYNRIKILSLKNLILKIPKKIKKFGDKNV